jgi:hypothetical protein
MINCLSPNNCVDVQRQALTLGANDYNGRILFRSSAALISTTGAALLLQGLHAYSLDTGVKQITQTFATATDIVPGIALPTWIDRAIPDWGVNVYLNSTTAPVYSVSYASFNVTYTESDFSNVAYTSEVNLEPLAMGYSFYDRTMQTEVETILLGVSYPPPWPVNPDIFYDYMGYLTGNQIPGLFKAFILFGQIYLFDGNYIYAASFTQAAFQGKGLPIAVATGMQLIATTPTEVDFLSSLDNSLYSFTGGRALAKIVRMNSEDTISAGVFSVHDNALLLNGTNTFIWVRDGIITSNAKKTNQAGTLGIFDTVNGIMICNNITSWQYSFFSLSGSTVVTLTYRTGYYGIKGSVITITNGWFVALYNPAPTTPITVTATCYSFDGENLSNNAASITINPADWTSEGIYRFKMQPTVQRAIATSIAISCATKIVINEITLDWAEDAAVSIPSVRSF